MKLIEAIEGSGLDWKPTGNKDEIRLTCPSCQKSGKLYINLRKGKGICFRCNEGGSAYWLLKQMGVKIDYKTKHKVPPYTSTISKPEAQPLKVKPATFPKEAKPVDIRDESPLGKRAIRYLILKRGLEWGDITAFDLMYCDKGEYAGYIVIPVREDGNLISWQGRQFLGNSLKAKNPSDGPGHNSFVYNGDWCRDLESIIIVEGPFDTIVAHRHMQAIGGGAIGLLGHAMSNTQAAIIGYDLKPKEAYIALDEDAHDDQAEIVNTLARYGVTSYECKLPVDPDELSEEELLGYVQIAKSGNKSISESS